MMPNDGRTEQQKGCISRHADRQQEPVCFIAPETITHHEESRPHCYVGHVERQRVARPVEHETDSDAHNDHRYWRYAPLDQETGNDTYEKERQDKPRRDVERHIAVDGERLQRICYAVPPCEVPFYEQEKQIEHVTYQTPFEERDEELPHIFLYTFTERHHLEEKSGFIEKPRH